MSAQGLDGGNDARRNRARNFRNKVLNFCRASPLENSKCVEKPDSTGGCPKKHLGLGCGRRRDRRASVGYYRLPHSNVRILSVGYQLQRKGLNSSLEKHLPLVREQANHGSIHRPCQPRLDTSCVAWRGCWQQCAKPPRTSTIFELASASLLFRQPSAHFSNLPNLTFVTIIVTWPRTTLLG